jgi:hypothetical protein
MAFWEDRPNGFSVDLGAIVLLEDTMLLSTVS